MSRAPKDASDVTAFDVTKQNVARAFAPASVANVAVGFDLMGFSAGVTGDTAIVEKISEPKVVVSSDSGAGLKLGLPTDPLMNTATAGLVRLIKDLKLPFGFRVSLEKGIPMGSGLGGSAASAVASILAANALLPEPLSKLQMLSYALIGEKVASGGYHADNIAPSLFGGFTLSTMRSRASDSSLPEADVVELPIPEDLWCVVLHPHVSLETKMSRGILKEHVPLKTHIAANGHLAMTIAAFYTGDIELIRGHLKDIVIEPQRAHLVPGFHDVQHAALSHKEALGCSISGAGPSIFAMTRGQGVALEIKDLMVRASTKHGPSTSWVFQIKKDGARVLS